MKKYRLQAELVLWKTAEIPVEDFIDYIDEFECPDEAKVRLDSLIVMRMTSKNAYRYDLINAKVLELPPGK